MKTFHSQFIGWMIRTSIWLDFGSLWGHYGIKTAFEMKSDPRIGFSDPKYLHSHEHITYKEAFGLWSPYGLQSPNSLGGPIWPHIWNQKPQSPTWIWPCAYWFYGMGLLAASEATTASKQPGRLNWTSFLKWQYWRGGCYSLQTASEVTSEIWPHTRNHWNNLPTNSCPYT